MFSFLTLLRPIIIGHIKAIRTHVIMGIDLFIDHTGTIVALIIKRQIMVFDGHIRGFGNPQKIIDINWAFNFMLSRCYLLSLLGFFYLRKI